MNRKSYLCKYFLFLSVMSTMSGLDFLTRRKKASGYGRILQPNAIDLPNGEKENLTEGGARTAVLCTKAGMVNGTMLAVELNTPSYAKSVPWLPNSAPFILSISNTTDLAINSWRTRWPGVKLKTTARERKDTWLPWRLNKWTTNYCRKWNWSKNSLTFIVMK